MKTVVIHHDYKVLPEATSDLIPVHIYGLGHHTRNDLSRIGHPVIEKLKRLGVRQSNETMDFLTIALAVTAADTFVRREDTADGWTRQIKLHIPLIDPDKWIQVQSKLEKTLHFLSGDLWQFEFHPDGFNAPVPYRSRHGLKLIGSRGCNSVSLFSGGLDSAIGAIDLLEQGNKPLLVSHAYTHDKIHQDDVAQYLKGTYSKFSLNADPHFALGTNDISMRTRSFNFLAFAVVASKAVEVVNRLDTVPLYIPENGFISLNAPLTPRRIGSLSTRTTHPYFLSSIKEIFDEVGINVEIINPYQFSTKGEMVADCKNQIILQNILEHTVSCSHWKRKNRQCGCCLPCLIRRAAIAKGKLLEPEFYIAQNLEAVLSSDNVVKDDLFAVIGAISRLENRSISEWIMDSGPLPMVRLEDFKGMFERGLDEIKHFLGINGIT